MKIQDNPKSRNQNLVVQELDNEIMIYDLNNNKVYSLNETSADIWGLCNGKNTIAEISRQMSEKLQTPVSEDYVCLALQDLQKENLLADEFEIENKFPVMSRRQVIRKIGFSSMVTLPVIYSLVAPTAITAQSGNVCVSCTLMWIGGGGGSPCATPGGCMATNLNSTGSTCLAACSFCRCTVPNGGTMCSSTCTMT